MFIGKFDDFLNGIMVIRQKLGLFNTLNKTYLKSYINRKCTFDNKTDSSA